MKITDIRIQNFGKLKEREISLTDGINIIYGPNESGKSTLHAFIRAMLFGLPRLRGRASRTDQYSRFEPWDRPVDYAGSMYFEAGNKEFCIERNFYKHDQRASLVCETDGEELSVEQGDFHMILGGISESVYDNTVSIGQLRAKTDEGMLRELQNFMVNYEGSGQGDLDLVKASDQLKRRKREWERKLLEARNRKQEERDGMESHISYRRKEIESLRHQIAGVEEEIKGLQSALQEEKEKEARHASKSESETAGKARKTAEDRAEKQELEKLQRQERKRQREEAETEAPIRYPFMEIMSLLLAMIAGCAVAFFGWWNPYLLPDTAKYSMMIAGVIIAAVSIWKLLTVYERHITDDEQDYEDGDDDEDSYEDSYVYDDVDEADYEKEGESAHTNEYSDVQDDSSNQNLYYDMYSPAQRIEQKINRLRGKEETLCQQAAEKEVEIDNLRENLEEFCGDTKEMQDCKTEIESLNLAMRTLRQLSEKMQRKIGTRLEYRMGEILQEITDDRYEQLRVDENINVELFEDRRWVSLQQLSRGTVEQVYFALRMAVSEILCEEKLPIVLDDVFGMYDELRLVQTLRWLSRRKGQILIFTCHKREMELLRRMGIQANVISL